MADSMKIEIGTYTKRFMDIDEVDLRLIYASIKPLTSIRVILSRDRYYSEFTDSNGVHQSVHRFLMKPAVGLVVDHIDGNSLNNQRNNLRIVSYSINMISRRKFAGFKTTTKLHHIVYKRRSKSFYVRIKKDGIEYSKGGFKTIEEAIEFHRIELPRLFPDDYINIFISNGYVTK